MSLSSLPDMTRCPLCGQANQCAMALEKSSGVPQEACWCVALEFPKALLEQLPPDAKGCICNHCVLSFDPSNQSLTHR